MFKAGNRVRIINNCSECEKGKEYTLFRGENNGDEPETLYARNEEVLSKGSSGCSCHENWELCESSNNKLTNKIMDIKEKFILALTAEPKKSFRKAGITDGDDMLTSEGQSVFLNWLLHSVYAEQFKTEVVEGLLKEDKEQK